jgi:hypothetical protein
MCTFSKGLAIAVLLMVALSSLSSAVINLAVAQPTNPVTAPTATPAYPTVAPSPSTSSTSHIPTGNAPVIPQEWLYSIIVSLFLAVVVLATALIIVVSRRAKTGNSVATAFSAINFIRPKKLLKVAFIFSILAPFQLL